MNIQQFNQLTQHMPVDSVIKMSCCDRDYTQHHPDCADFGTLCYDGEGLMFQIDWNRQATITLEEYRALIHAHHLSPHAPITSIDEDDNMEIEFEGVVIHGNEIILV